MAQGETMELRSTKWFSNSENPAMTALYLERYLNYGLTREELQSGKPIIGIAQTGSDLSPCNRHHLELAKRTREGIVAAGGICFEFPVHPIQETGKRPTAALDRNLAYLGLVEVLYGYPLDGVVLTIGCDKTTPLRHGDLELPSEVGGWRDRPGRVHAVGGRRCAFGWVLQLDGDSQHDELFGRGARHAAARFGGHPCAVP
jgi:hypothetical protein